MKVNNINIEKTKIYNESGMFSPLISYVKKNVGIFAALFGICIFLSIFTDSFLTTDNLVIVLRQVSLNALIACAMTLVIIFGGIDLSVSGILAMCGVITTLLIAIYNVPIPIAIIIGLLAGLLFGLINGIIIAKTDIHPFIVTLATAYITRGFGYIFAAGKPISISDPSFIRLGNGYFGPIPYLVIYMFIATVVFALILNKTIFGRHISAIGGNIIAAKYSGINIARIQIITYGLIGLMAGFTGIVLSARLYSGQPTVGADAALDAIAAVILGGTSFSGGVGSVFGTLIGAIIIGVINNGLNLLGINSFWQMVAKGVIILLAVYVDTLKKKSKTN